MNFKRLRKSRCQSFRILLLLVKTLIIPKLVCDGQKKNTCSPDPDFSTLTDVLGEGENRNRISWYENFTIRVFQTFFIQKNVDKPLQKQLPTELLKENC